ncbi:hypothetical protein [Halarcobacter sp.]|uniref:hypothetical protein n=1 Tax=Halarcobacter sp. TaxID=2321133 RepID=UPI002AA75014|nr:hypothetical protein [Halarcobacter sp.]
MNMKIRPIDINFERSDVLLVCMSFEKERWKKYLLENSYKKYIIFYNEEFINNYQDEMDFFHDKEKFIFVKTSISDPLNTIDNYIDYILDFENSTMDLDCSTFTHEHLMIILKVLSHIKINSSINLIYTSMKHYLTFQESGWLSKGVKEIRNIIGYSGNLLPSKKLHLILLVGLENERIQKIIQEYEPYKISVGKGSFESSFTNELSKYNDTLHEKVDKFTKNIISDLDNIDNFEFSCNNAENTYKTLNKIINNNKEFNNVIIAANSKISTIGVAKIGLMNEDIQICYAQPIEYNTDNYTKTFNEFKFYELSFIDE